MWTGVPVGRSFAGFRRGVPIGWTRARPPGRAGVFSGGSWSTAGALPGCWAAGGAAESVVPALAVKSGRVVAAASAREQAARLVGEAGECGPSPGRPGRGDAGGPDGRKPAEQQRSPEADAPADSYRYVPASWPAQPARESTTGAPRPDLPAHPDTKPKTRTVVPGQGTLSRLDAVPPSVVTIRLRGGESTKRADSAGTSPGAALSGARPRAHRERKRADPTPQDRTQAIRRAVDPRTTSSGANSSSSAATSPPLIRFTSSSTTARPIASIGWRVVVSGGSVQFISAESS